MQRLFLYIALLLLSTLAVQAQTCPKVAEAIKAFQAKDLESARKGIESASEDPACASQPSTWYYKAFILKDHYRVKESTAKDSRSRISAIEAAKKNLDLDPANKYADECRKIISFLAVSFYNDAAKDLNDQKYAASHASYIQYLDVIKIAQPTKTDTAAIFYAGYTAYMARNYGIAKQYLLKAKQLKYKDPNLYFCLGKVLWALGEKEESLEILNTGLNLFPENREIPLTLVNYYLEEGKLKNLENILEKAIQLDPKNPDLKITLAIICEKLMETEKSQQTKYFNKAEKLYLQVVAIDSNIFTSNFNLGLLYYNKAVSIINAAEIDADLDVIYKIQDECVPIFKQGLPYMLTAYRIKPEKKEVLEALAGIYFALGEIEKSNNFKKKSEAIK